MAAITLKIKNNKKSFCLMIIYMNTKVDATAETSCISNTGLLQTTDNAQYIVIFFFFFL
jgi:hypothetical protein